MSLLNIDFLVRRSLDMKLQSLIGFCGVVLAEFGGLSMSLRLSVYLLLDTMGLCVSINISSFFFLDDCLYSFRIESFFFWSRL